MRVVRKAVQMKVWHEGVVGVIVLTEFNCKGFLGDRKRGNHSPGPETSRFCKEHSCKAQWKGREEEGMA